MKPLVIWESLGQTLEAPQPTVCRETLWFCLDAYHVFQKINVFEWYTVINSLMRIY